jgi:ribosome-associated protein
MKGERPASFSDPFRKAKGGFVVAQTAGRSGVALANNERSLALAVAAARTAQEHNGSNVVVLDMREVTPIFDYFVIATGTSRRQIHAMSEEIDHKLEDDLGDKRLHIAGYDESRWVVLDYGDVVVHLFDEETRRYYALEDLWGQATRVEWNGQPVAAPRRAR